MKISLSAILKREGKQTIATQSLISSYASYYKKQNVSLVLLQNENLLFGNMPQAVAVNEKLHNLEGERRSIIQNVAGRKYLFVSGSLPDPLQDYTLVYAYDLSLVVQSQAKLTQFLIGVNSIGGVDSRLVLQVAVSMSDGSGYLINLDGYTRELVGYETRPDGV